MRKLLNVLYVTNPQSYLSKDGDNVVVYVEGRREGVRVPIHNLEGIVCFGYMGASPQLMQMCAERNVGLSFVSESGRFLARVTGRISGSILLRKKQYRLYEDPQKSCGIAKNCVLGKLLNCRSVLRRFLRDHSDRSSEQFEDRLQRLDALLHSLKQYGGSDMDELRGLEGMGSRTYFECFDELILAQKESFAFHGRSKRPPLDPMNALLSFLYALIVHDVESGIEAVGLDPQAGFLHRDRPGRSGLALDLMEEFRPYLGDRAALTLVNNQMVGPRDFIIKENGAIYMTPDCRKTVLTFWQKRKKGTVVHPFLGEKIEIGLLPYVQALLMARFLRGDLDAYPPFLMR